MAKNLTKLKTASVNTKFEFGNFQEEICRVMEAHTEAYGLWHTGLVEHTDCGT